MDGKVDVVMATAGDDAQLIQMLTRQSGVQILGIGQAGSLASKQSVLQPLLLPEGSLELGNNLPPRDVTMASMQTHLVIKPTLHPALQRALIDAAIEIHEEPTFLQRHGQFPDYGNSDFPLSPFAKAYSQGNRPYLETLLPYRTAQLAELLLFAVVPIIAVTLFMLAWIPRWFDWRVNSALHHFYSDLKFLESEMENVAISNPMGLRALIERLDAIEQQVVKMELPDEFSDRWYTLRQHLTAAQERMFKLRSRLGRLGASLATFTHMPAGLGAEVKVRAPPKTFWRLTPGKPKPWWVSGKIFEPNLALRLPSGQSKWQL